jgi:multisubunit Na+/H+ antiporter MnhE subunit
MNPRTRAGLQLLVLLIVGVVLMLIFPSALRFAEGAAREVRYLWWLILLVALAVWLIWGANRKPKP